MSKEFKEFLELEKEGTYPIRFFNEPWQFVLHKKGSMLHNTHTCPYCEAEEIQSRFDILDIR